MVAQCSSANLVPQHFDDVVPSLREFHGCERRAWMSRIVSVVVLLVIQHPVDCFSLRHSLEAMTGIGSLSHPRVWYPVPRPSPYHPRALPHLPHRRRRPKFSHLRQNLHGDRAGLWGGVRRSRCSLHFGSMRWARKDAPRRRRLRSRRRALVRHHRRHRSRVYAFLGYL